MEKSTRRPVGLLQVTCRISSAELVLQAVFVTSSIGILEYQWASQLTVPGISEGFAHMGFGRECQRAGDVTFSAVAEKREESS